MTTVRNYNKAWLSQFRLCWWMKMIKYWLSTLLELYTLCFCLIHWTSIIYMFQCITASEQWLKSFAQYCNFFCYTLICTWTHWVSCTSSLTCLFILPSQPHVEATIRLQVEWYYLLGGLVITKTPLTVSGWLKQNLDVPSKSHLTGGWHTVTLWFWILERALNKQEWRFTRFKVYGHSPTISHDS